MRRLENGAQSGLFFEPNLFAQGRGDVHRASLVAQDRARLIPGATWAAGAAEAEFGHGPAGHAKRRRGAAPGRILLCWGCTKWGCTSVGGIDARPHTKKLARVRPGHAGRAANGSVSQLMPNGPDTTHEGASRTGRRNTALGGARGSDRATVGSRDAVVRGRGDYDCVLLFGWDRRGPECELSDANDGWEYIKNRGCVGLRDVEIYERDGDDDDVGSSSTQQQQQTK